jgi:hypothetical protein
MPQVSEANPSRRTPLSSAASTMSAGGAHHRRPISTAAAAPALPLARPTRHFPKKFTNIREFLQKLHDERRDTRVVVLSSTRRHARGFGGGGECANPW